MACLTCCMQDTESIDVQMKTKTLSKSAEFLPDPPQEAKEQELTVDLPPQPVNTDESNMAHNQVGTTGGASVFVVEIEKTPTMMKVGLDIDHSVEQAIGVLLVKEGLIQIYNEGAVESRKIKAGNRIIEVNGITKDKKKMIQTIGLESKLHFVIEPSRRD